MKEGAIWCELTEEAQHVAQLLMQEAPVIKRATGAVFGAQQLAAQAACDEADAQDAIDFAVQAGALHRFPQGMNLVFWSQRRA